MAAIVAVMVVGISPPAQAKGPESVTVAGPGISGELELISGDAEHVGRLVELSGVWLGTGDLPVPLEGEPATPLGPAYTLTWLALGPPGVTATDRTIRQVVYPYAENGPIIHTRAVPDGWGQDVLGWFAASPDLNVALVGLGVPLDTPPAEGGSRPLVWVMFAAAMLIAVLVRRRSAPPARLAGAQRGS